MGTFFSLYKRTVYAACIAALVIGIAANCVMISESTAASGAFAPERKLPVYSVNRSDMKVAISFDAAWGDDSTLGILDILDTYGIRTTFFLVGFWIDKYPGHVREISARGHEIGNHSATHPNMPSLSAAQMADELNTTGRKIEELTGKRPSLFRPPYGDYSNRLIEVCAENGYTAVQWSVDSLDWKELGIQPMVDRVLGSVSSGDIILFHNNSKYIKEALPIILDGLISRGYTVVPVSELLLKGDTYLDHTGRQFSR